MTMQMLLARRRMMMQQAVTPSDTYLTFTANTAGSTIAMQANGSAPALSLEYSTDGGVTWQTFTVGSTTVTLANVGDKVKMRGVNAQLCSYISNYNKFVMTGSVAASGDLTSLINGVGGNETVSASYAFVSLFNGCTALTAAPSMPIIISQAYGFYQMYYGCTSLVEAPELFNTNIPNNGYREMFMGCSSLNRVKINATSLGTKALLDWLSGVSATGELHCDQSLTLPTGVSGLPSGWTRYNLDGTPY